MRILSVFVFIFAVSLAPYSIFAFGAQESGDASVPGPIGDDDDGRGVDVDGSASGGDSLAQTPPASDDAGTTDTLGAGDTAMDESADDSGADDTETISGEMEDGDTLGAGEADEIFVPGPINGEDDDEDVEIEGSTSDVPDNQPGGGDQGLSQAAPETDDDTGESTVTITPEDNGDSAITISPGESADDALGSGEMDQTAVLETTGAMRLRFSEVDGYDFGNGSVRDLVINQDGTIQYVVVNLDDSEGDFLVPPAQISFETVENGIRPSLNLADTGTLTQVQGEAQAGTASAGEGAVFASDLVDYQVLGSGNEEIGDIDDIMINLETGSIAYLAIAEGGFLGIGENMVAVSPDSIQINPQDGTVTVNLSADELMNMTFEQDNWPADAQVGVEADATLGAGDTMSTESDTGAGTEGMETTEGELGSTGDLSSPGTAAPEDTGTVDDTGTMGTTDTGTTDDTGATGTAEPAAEPAEDAGTVAQ